MSTPSASTPYKNQRKVRADVRSKTLACIDYHIVHTKPPRGEERYFVNGWLVYGNNHRWTEEYFGKGARGFFDNLRQYVPEHEIFKTVENPGKDHLNLLRGDILTRLRLYWDEEGTHYNKPTDEFHMTAVETLLEQNHHSPSDGGPPSLQDLARFEVLKSVFAPQFVCSGVIKASLYVFWRTEKSTNAARWLRLPHPAERDLYLRAMDELQAECYPDGVASDRNSGGLDPEHFSTTFSPDDLLVYIRGILFTTDWSNRQMTAKLHKLNIFPVGGTETILHPESEQVSGTETIHPSSRQIGWLVVCLPSQFKGGRMAISHERKDILGKKVAEPTYFDWSTRSCLAIQWAAFLYDCKQKIEPISEGCMITLLYRLCWTDNSTAEPDPLPCYQDLQIQLESSAFMTYGGVVGYFCDGDYEHTSNSAVLDFPSALKGKDYDIHEFWTSLEYKVGIFPVLEQSDGYIMQHTETDPFANIRSAYEKHLRKGFKKFDSIEERAAEIYKIERWEKAYGRKRSLDVAHVGAQLYRLCGSNVRPGDYDPAEEGVFYRFHRYPGIHWVNRRGVEKLALFHCSEWGPQHFKSCLAMLIVIPSWEERKEKKEGEEKEREDKENKEKEREGGEEGEDPE